MIRITANDLKTKGVSIIEGALQEDHEAVITVRGECKYAVLDWNAYSQLREYELNMAIQEARNDIASGDYKTESIDEHIRRVLG
ncbi:MAG: hypothetical protein OXG56_01980 [Gammaproteobacteria bacterium]|nr:hypothetical protein [Gammaproteobacteria bacterium]